MEQLKGLREAKEALSVITTVMLSPSSGSSLGAGKVFFAHFLMRMNVVWTEKLPTAGVSITNKVNLYINPTFFLGLTPIERMELLEHEIEHIVYMHPLRAKDYISTEKNAEGRHKCANIAMDANINENKPHISKNGVTVAKLNAELKSMGSKYQLDLKDPWEIHYEKLMQAAKENPQKGTGGFGDPTDDHDIWSESTDSKEVAEGIIKDTANKAQQATGIGNMPSEMLREIMNMNKASVNWQQQMRQFATRNQQFDFTKTRNRRNRRYGVIQPGRKKKPKLRIAACADSSGSVGDASFSQYFAELGEIHKMDIEIVVIDADSGVAEVYDFDPKKPFKRYGNGGTAYSPAIQKAVELKVDAIIYFGDMDSSDTPEDPGVPFLWAVVGSQNPPGNFGKTIRITETSK